MSNSRDDFWDIEKLIPKRKNNIAPFSTKEKVAEITIKAEDTTESDGNTRLTIKPQEVNSSENAVYSFTDGLIRSVTIKRFVDKYDFYGNFRKAAIVYYDFKTPKCDFVPFYSYMPQYSQFNSQQKNFYFYWRDCVRRKKYIKTDYSYFYLYVYEILNLPDKISPTDGLEILTTLWMEYRKELPNIDANMSLWVQDYCLIYNLACPMDKIGGFIFNVIGAAEFKEFYLSDVHAMGDSGIEAMIAYLSDYDWRSGKYAGGDNREVYSKHLIKAMGMLIGELWQCGEIISSAQSTVHLTRSAFKNSLCTHSVKCNLDIEYIPLSKSESVRRSVTAALKYTENKLRALLGIKSRLAVKDLPSEYKAVIDGYFTDIFEKANRERIKASMPEYEKLYDAEPGGMSFEGAIEIEKASWTTTARLVIADDEDELAEEEKTPEIKEETESSAPIPDTYGLSLDEIAFLSAVASGNTEGIKTAASEIGLPIDGIAERINEAFADNFGDVIIEGEAPDLNIIEDYKEDIKEWLLKTTR